MQYLGTPRSDESAVRLNTPNQIVRQFIWIGKVGCTRDEGRE
jgi:hypothetical protein